VIDGLRLTATKYDAVLVPEDVSPVQGSGLRLPNAGEAEKLDEVSRLRGMRAEGLPADVGDNRLKLPSVGTNLIGFWGASSG
jgi:hypothetical protein